MSATLLQNRMVHSGIAGLLHRPGADFALLSDEVKVKSVELIQVNLFLAAHINSLIKTPTQHVRTMASIHVVREHFGWNGVKGEES